MKGWLMAAVVVGELMLEAVVVPVAGVQAQTIEARMAEAQAFASFADQLFKQGIEQYEKNQFEAASQSWQQALELYHAVKNRQSEGYVVGYLGNAFISVGNYAQAMRGRHWAI
jgi:hypothetical protein